MYEAPVEMKLAYIAGLVDGEGCILIKRRMPSKANHLTSPKYSVCFSIAMTDFEPVQIVAQHFNVEHLITPRTRKAHYKTIYQLDVEHGKAADILSALVPYLIGKKIQAEKALRLATLREVSRKHRTRVNGAKPQGRGLSDEFIAQCEDLYQSLKKINPRSGQAGAWGNRSC